MSYEQDIVDAYSTPGLRKHVLDRFSKREQLNAQGMAKFPEDRDKLLDQLYPVQGPNADDGPPKKVSWSSSVTAALTC